MARSRIAHEVDSAVIAESAKNEQTQVFAQTLNTLLFEKNIHQDDFAMEIGVATGTISAYRRGSKEPKLSNLIKMAEYLGVDCNYLMTGVKAENAVAASELGLTDGAISKLQKISIENRVTAFSDIVSLLIEDFNAEYFLSLIGSLISISFDGSGKDLINVDVDGSRMSSYKEKHVQAMLQINLIENLSFIAKEYLQRYKKSPVQRKKEFDDYARSLKHKTVNEEISEEQRQELISAWLEGSVE